MNIQSTILKDVYVIEPHIYRDERGYFLETFNCKKFKEKINKFYIIQENQSKSKHGVIRGLHYQEPPFTQAKIVSVVKGIVLDVVVDIRTDSLTFGQYYSIVLDGKNKRQLFVPRGFAHGFITLSKDAIFQYKVDNLYSPQHETGIRFDDKDLNIDWGIKYKIIISKKDGILNKFTENTYHTKAEYDNNPYEMPLLK
jgi:dTDP-4-dehydrorhamnose 3,5-epimerase